MGLVFFGGFETGTINGEFSGIAAPVVTLNYGFSIAAGGRSGSYQGMVSQNLGDWTNQVVFNFPTALSEFFFQVALYSNSSAVSWDVANRTVLKWESGTTVLGGLKFNFATSLFEVYTGAMATLVGTFAAPLSKVWTVLEIHLIIGDSGTIEIRLDMNPVFTFSGDTKPAALTTIDRIEISNLYNQSLYVDDFVLNDISGSVMNSWPGGLRVACLLPTADDGTNQWTPSTAVAHYSTIDELPPSATDYLESATAAQVERWGLGNLPGAATVVHAVKAVAQARKDSASAPSQIALGMTIGVIDYYSSGLLLPVFARSIANQWLVSPATLIPFTPAEVNGMKMLLKSVT